MKIVISASPNRGIERATVESTTPIHRHARWNDNRVVPALLRLR